MIVGIDLGTSTSEIAYLDKNNRVVVIPNIDGELITPSIIHIKRNGRAVIGNEAKELLFTRPESTFIEVKREFGKDVKLTAHGVEYAPEEIQARLISYLVDSAEQYTGEDVTSAVITVPAYFTDVQRKQTIRAGELANLKVERIINEPTSAALDYGLHNLEKNEYILVYDFGGGTLDVTVLELFDGVIDVKASSGNNRLGGKDFDSALMEFIAGRHYGAIQADPGAKMKLKQAAESCKIALSADESTNVRLPLICGDISISRAVTRADFENLIGAMVESTGEQIDAAMRDAGLAPSDIGRVILVGGTTRVPLVKRFVREKLGIKPQINDTSGGAPESNAAEASPELMVVRGAAIQSAIIENRIPTDKSVILADICPFTLGLQVVSQNGLIVDPLINRNVTIPYDFSNVYSALHEKQDAIMFQIYQGESKIPQENVRIGQLYLDKLPKRQNERANAEVTFSYDVSGVLHVKARALGNDNTVATDIDINNNDQPNRPAVRLSDWEKAGNASHYRPLLRKAEKLMDKYIGTQEFIDSDMYVLQKMCNDLKADLILADLDAADKTVEHIKSCLELMTLFDKTMGRYKKLTEDDDSIDYD